MKNLSFVAKTQYMRLGQENEVNAIAKYEELHDVKV